MKFRTILFSSILSMIAFSALKADAGYPSGYYDSLEGKCGAELMEAVKNVAKNHKVISYGESTWSAFRYTDVITIDGVDYW